MCEFRWPKQAKIRGYITDLLRICQTCWLVCLVGALCVRKYIPTHLGFCCGGWFFVLGFSKRCAPGYCAIIDNFFQVRKVDFLAKRSENKTVLVMRLWCEFQ